MGGTIRLFRAGGRGWCADFADHATGPETLELFGTAILPLPWTASANPLLVLDALQRLHPGARVVLACAASVAALPTSGRGFCDVCHEAAELLDTADDANICRTCAPGRISARA